MNFDYTYITLFGYQIFEPLVFVSNSIIFSVTLFAYLKLKKHKHEYAKFMALFFIFLGTSSLFGAVCHMVHYNLGQTFFDVFFFIMNTLSILSIYYCFRSAHFFVQQLRPSTKFIVLIAKAWIFALIVFCFLNNNFLLVKINAAIALIYSLIVHYIASRKSNDNGSKLVVTGILVSFSTFIIHSFKISIDEWFNYKDISHVIMIAALIIIFKGAFRNSQELLAQSKVQP